jgi:hypothetical protein
MLSRVAAVLRRSGKDPRPKQGQITSAPLEAARCHNSMEQAAGVDPRLLARWSPRQYRLPDA